MAVKMAAIFVYVLLLTVGNVSVISFHLYQFVSL